MSDILNSWESKSPTPQAHSGGETAIDTTTWILFGLVLAIAAWLRLYGLGVPALERNHDEDITAAAVLGILAHDYPLLPGGMIYIRSLPLLYLMAELVGLFGFNEFNLRLPSALFGILLVPMVFWIGRRYFGVIVALVAAALISLSIWEIDVSRTARMYSPFAFLFIASVFGICRGYVDGSRLWRWVSLPSSLLTVTMHSLGFTLGAVFAIAALIPGLPRSQKSMAVASTAITAVWFLQWDSWQSMLFNRPFALNQPVTETVPQNSLVDMILGRLYLPENFLFLSEDFVIWGVIVTAAIIIAAGIGLVRGNPELLKARQIIPLAICIGFGLVHQFLMAGLFYGVFVLLKGHGMQAAFRRDSLTVLGILSILFAIWFSLGVTLGGSDGSLSVYETLRALLDYPRAIVFRHFFVSRPILTILGAIGILAALHSASRQRALTPQAFLAIALISTLVLHGVFDSQFRPRYNYNVDPIFLIFVALGGFVAVRTILARLRVHKAENLFRAPSAAAILVFTFVMVIAAPDIRAMSIPRYLNFDSQQKAAWADKFRIHRLMWPADRKSPAIYVSENRAADDEIMTMDWITTYVYAGGVDYWLQGPGHFESYSYETAAGNKEIYLGATVIPDASSLEGLLSEPCRGDIWIISSGWIMTQQPQKLNDGILRVLADLEQQKVYTGSDGLSAVYRVPSRAPCPGRQDLPVEGVPD